MHTSHRLYISAAVLAASGAAASAQIVITAPTDDIIAVLHDLGNSYSLPDGNFPTGEGPTNAINGSLSDKYLNFFGAGLNDNGEQVNNPSGFIVTLSTKGASPINGFRMGTGNDFPSRDPAFISIEGGNFGTETSTDIANTDADTDWTLVYYGPSGISVDQNRNTFGSFISFPTSAAYSSYRVIITDLVRYAGQAPTTSQFSEMEMTYTAAPEPATLGLLGASALGVIWLRRSRRWI